MGHTTRMNRLKTSVAANKRGNDDIAIAQSSAGGQQLSNDPADGHDPNHRTEDSQGVERLSLVDSD